MIPALWGDLIIINEEDKSVGWSTNFKNEYEPGSLIGFSLRLYYFYKSFPIKIKFFIQ